MKRHLRFFALMAAAISFIHYLLVLSLGHLALFGSPGITAISAPVVWLLTAPMNLLLTSSFGHSLSPAPLQILYILNSVIWGSLFSGIVLWRRARNMGS
jgi:hypothetical protein